MMARAVKESKVLKHLYDIETLLMFCLNDENESMRRDMMTLIFGFIRLLISDIKEKEMMM